VLHHQRLKRDVHGVMLEIAKLGDIEASFYDDYTFKRENVSFLAKHRRMQRWAIVANNRLESVWRKHPALKQRLLSVYKRMNERPLDPDVLTPQTLEQLKHYYSPTYTLLESVIP
jgi:hypothetical protein